MLDGFVYILIHPRMPDLVKIGCTRRSSEKRAIELSRETGVPSRYRVAYEERFQSVLAAEEAVLKKLQGQREADSQEHFEVTLKRAIAIVRTVKREAKQQGNLFPDGHPTRQRHTLRRMIDRFERRHGKLELEYADSQKDRRRLKQAAEALNMDYDEVVAGLEG